MSNDFYFVDITQQGINTIIYNTEVTIQEAKKMSSLT